MQLLNFTIIKLTICLIVGIIVGYFFNIPKATSLYITIFLLCLLLMAFLKAKKQFKKTIWFGILAFSTFISIGVLTVSFHNQKNFSKHYSHSISKSTDSLKTITFRVREVLKPGYYYDKYVIDVLKVNNKSVNGKSLLNIEKDSLLQVLKVDDIYIAKTYFKDLIHPLKPNQFDYKNYLEKKYIYHQLFIEPESLLKVNSNTHTLLGVANHLRTHINSKLEPLNFKPDELAIINALFLGQRQDISKEVYSSYTNAGAVHILAVSGLHVGIILLILTLFLNLLNVLNMVIF